MKQHLPFWLLELICLIIGHKWEKTPNVSCCDPYDEMWRPGEWCQRCRKTR